MKLILYFFLFFMTSTSLCAQIYMDRFDDYFASDSLEVEQIHRGSHSYQFVYVPVQKIPAWFSDLPLNDSLWVYSIGISNPGMDSVDAMQLAIKRAAMMSCVLNNANARLLYSYYKNESGAVQSAMYENYAQIISSFPAAYVQKGMVVSYAYNEYQEGMVLMKFLRSSMQERDEDQRLELIRFGKEWNKQQGSVFEASYELNCGSKEDKFGFSNYEVYHLDLRMHASGLYLDLSYVIPIYSLCYSNDSIASTKRQCFSYGLWAEYYKSFLDQVIASSRKSPESIESLAASYQNSDHSELIQGISNTKQSFALKNIAIRNNILQVHLIEVDVQF